MQCHGACSVILPPPSYQIILNMIPYACGSVRQHVGLRNAQVGKQAEHLDTLASSVVSSKV